MPEALVTAGPTYEAIDPVRFIGNRSSGKMGFALAEELASRGFTVHLVSGPSALTASHPNIKLTRVESAQQMYDASVAVFSRCSLAICAAAVADFTPATIASEKIKKKEGQEEMTLTLVRTKDILAELGRLKNESQVLVGFALETENELSNAQGKLRRKRADYIALNSLRSEGSGFEHETNEITLLSSTGKQWHLPLQQKSAVADAMLSIILA